MTKHYDRPMSLEELANVRDEDIDYSDIPKLDEEWFRTATVVYPETHAKQQLTMRVDKDIVDWFKGQGKGYQTRMNAVLRAYYNGVQRPDAGSKKSRKIS